MSRVIRATNIGVRVSKLIKAPTEGSPALEGLEPVLIDRVAHAAFVRNVFALRAKTGVAAKLSRKNGQPTGLWGKAP